MVIILDLTNQLSSAVDYDNGGGLTTFIDIALTKELINKFEFRLFNFILNLDENLIKKIEEQANSLGKLTEEGFLIIKDAFIRIEEVKDAMRNSDFAPKVEI